MGTRPNWATYVIAGSIGVLASIAVSAQTSNLDTKYARGGPANAVLFADGGNLISFCPQLACVTKPTPDHQRATALFAGTTSDDGHSEEQTVAIETTIKTGGMKQWAPGTFFTRGDNIAFGGAVNAVYRAVKAGISEPHGHGPRGKGDNIADGSVKWAWINDAAIASKVGLYNETAIYPGSGAAWGQANNVHMQPGTIPNFDLNTELDFVNDAADCKVGLANCINLMVSSGGAHQSTTGLYVESENTDRYAVHWGIRIAGKYLASEEDLEDDAQGPVGIGLGLFGKSAHSRAAILDASLGPVSYMVTGDHSNATIEDLSNSPSTLDVGGKHQIAGILERSESRNGIKLTGRYAEAQIVGTGFRVAPDGAVISTSIEASARLAVPVSRPTSSASPCTKGQIEFDAAYVYTCIARNKWRRAATAPF